MSLPIFGAADAIAFTMDSNSPFLASSCFKMFSFSLFLAASLDTVLDAPDMLEVNPEELE